MTVAPPGVNPVTLTVFGTNFVNGSTVVWRTPQNHLQPPRLIPTSVNSRQLTVVVPSLEIANAVTALITVENPGPNDTVLVSNAVPFTVTLPTTSLFFRLTVQSPSAGKHPSVPVFGDFDGDGSLDIAVSNENQGGVVSIFYGNGSGSFAGALNSTFPAGLKPEGMTVGDFDNDGYLDIAIANMGASSYTILRGSTDKTFINTATPPATSIPFPINGTQPYAIEAGDFNQDGYLDLAVACQDAGTGGFVYILLGNGDGTFADPLHYGSFGQPEGLALADFNGDGLLDIAVSDFSNDGVWVLTGNGDGTFSSGTFYSVPPGSGPTGIVASDFNGDGQTDLAVVNLTSGTVSILINSSGSFTAQTPIPVAGGGYFLAAADLNGDNVTDLAVANYGAGNFSSLFGKGDGTFQPYASYPVDPNTKSILGLGVADVNSDGRFDVVTTTDLPDSVIEVMLQTGRLNPSPASLNFPSTALGASSAPMTVTLGNSGSATLTIHGISSTDSEFPETNTCGSFPVTLLTGASCTVSVTFAPSAEGSRSGSISISDDASSSAQTVPLTGMGLAPEATLAPGSLAFGNQLDGTGSTAQTATLTNNGNAALAINSIAVTSGYTETSMCGASLPANSSCSINVRFTPTTLGAINGTLTVTDNSNDGTNATQTVALGGTGIGPAASLSPVSLTFSNQLLSTSSAAQSTTLSNKGTAPLKITSIAVGGSNGGDFSQSNTCGISVASGASCTISVMFKPAAIGTRSATVTVTDNSGGVTAGTQTASLTGTGIAPLASLAPSSLPAFPATLVGTSTTAQFITMSNAGMAALSVTSIAITGTNSADFSQSNTCGTSIAAGANCTVSVMFKPTATGARAGSLVLTDNNNAIAGSTETIPLSGSGTAPVAGVTPSALPAFAGQRVGTSSAAQTVTLSNSGTAPLTVASIVLGGTNGADFAESSTCGTSVAVGANCTISVTFAPTDMGTRNATVTITDNTNALSGSAQLVSLTGAGTQSAVKLSVSSLSFPNEHVGAASVVQPVTITNSGNAPLAMTSITVGGDYAISNPCGTSLAVGGSCVVNVTFKPTAIGSRGGTLTVTDDASPASQTVSLSGTGLGAQASLSGDGLTFGAELVGASSAAQTITIKNTGNAAMAMTGIVASGDFTETNTCGSSVAADGSCTVSVSFAAKSGGTRRGTLTLTDNSVGATSQTATLTGTGQDFTLTATSSSFTVSPGQTATYNLTLAPSASFTESVSLSCAGLASNSETSCTVSPSSVTLTGATPIKVTVDTTAPARLLPISSPRPPLPGGNGEWILVALFSMVAFTWLARRRPLAIPVRLRVALTMACLIVVLALGVVACGGSGSSRTTTPVGGTPRGNYSLTLTGSASSGAVTDTHTIGLTMTVQ